ncbi:glycosyltransferase [Actinophytocola sp.]|uniref:glycosyltransferase n=1 Tax=Actinophytocola sp. TaxID=1872138 RepID=UPI0025BA0239|nr:glycosyltransferase [Actinophytocola sp.]
MPRCSPRGTPTCACASGWRRATSCSSATSAGWHRRSRCTGWPRCTGCRACAWWSSARGRRSRCCARCCRTRRSWAFAPGAELAAAYASLDVFVHTGPHETFCQAAQEALASGLPVIAPDAGGPRDLVEHGRTGFLLEPHADTRFAAELWSTVELPRHKALRRRIGAAARESVLARTWPAVCDELLGHYDQVSSAMLAA